MPRDFGDWLGDHKPMDFNDPGALPSSKPAAKRVKCDGNHGGPACADPECWHGSAHLTEGYDLVKGYTIAPRRAGKTIAQAHYLMTGQLGFTYYPGPDAYKRGCRMCGQPILVAMTQASEYLRAHQTFGSDPCICLHCSGVKVSPPKRFP